MRTPARFRDTRPAAAAFLALVLASCGGDTTSPPSATTAAPSTTEPAAELVLVAIGDSIPYNLPADCPGCTGFVDSYGRALEVDLGQAVNVLNRSRHDGAQTADILEQLESDEHVLAELAIADVIVMSVGFNDQPPFDVAYDGCPDPVTDNDSIQILAERAAATSHECIDSAVQVLRRHVADVFARVREQAPDAGIGTLTPYDTWLGWSGLDSLDAPTRDGLHEAVGYWMREFRGALCGEAAAVGAVCVDVYSAFNGPDGTEPPADFVAADYTHPSQEGNDVIRDLLMEANLSQR